MHQERLKNLGSSTRRLTDDLGVRRHQLRLGLLGPVVGGVQGSPRCPEGFFQPRGLLALLGVQVLCHLQATKEVPGVVAIEPSINQDASSESEEEEGLELPEPTSPTPPIVATTVGAKPRPAVEITLHRQTEIKNVDQEG